MANAPLQFQEVLNAVGDYYKVGSDQWEGFCKYGLAYQDLENVLDPVPGVTIYKNNAGAITGYAYEDPFAMSTGGTSGALNSNLQLPTQGNGNTFMGNIPASGTIDQSGNAQLSSGAKRVSDNSAVPSTMGVVSTAIAGLSFGTKLGANILQTIYDSDPDYWDNTYPTINPQTWDSIAGSNALGKGVINAIFGIDKDNGNAQMYLPEDAFAYFAYAMKEQGFFGSGVDEVPSYNPQSSAWNLSQPTRYNYPVQFGGASVSIANLQSGTTQTWTANGSGTIYSFLYKLPTQETWQYTLYEPPYFLSDQEFTLTKPDGTTQQATWNSIGGVRLYAVSGGGTGNRIDMRASSIPVNLMNNGGPNVWDLAKLCFNGDMISGGGHDGVEKQDGATFPDTSNWTNIAATAQDLATKYSDAYQNAIYTDVPQKDGTTTRIKYIPINTTATTGSEDTTPTNTTVTYNQTVVNGSTSDEDLIKTILRYITQTQSDSKSDTPNPPDTPNPTDTGTGDTPTIVMPTGQASALWSVYNPSQAELNSFGAWLWSSNFIDQILKLFNNPMQSIIGVHKIFATPAVSGAGTITVGYLNSGVSANLVSNQYTDINCGTVNVREQFGNVFDYTDTHIRLYLPFIGIVDLDTADVMRGAVNVVYHVDVITGACLAEVKIDRDASGGTLYQFAGDAAVRYPISSGSYMGVVSGILSAVGGVASAVMTGGATLPLAAGAVAGGISGAHTQVQHSGNFSGNAGAMGGKKPYIIIERPQSYIADDFKHWQGLGANTRRTVGQMSGYFKFSDVHTESISKAAESEIEAIRAALESGVIA